MKLLFSTSDFLYAGRPRPGFPLILSDDMTPLEPFHTYLRWVLLERGNALAVTTWDSYGRVFWDYAYYLHINGFKWNQSHQSFGESVIAVYRDWQAQDLKLARTTINRRIGRVTSFYLWAVRRGMLEKMPLRVVESNAHGIAHDLAHVTDGEQTVSKSNLTLDEWEEEPVFLTAQEAQVARKAIRSTAHRLLFDLMARVGLRSIEARTFPLSLVFDPSSKPNLKPGSLISVYLDPRLMDIKKDKPRWVDIPYSLMEEMYAYSQFERNRHVDVTREQKTLLLTVHGNSYSKGSVHKVMKDLGVKVGFSIRPRMLRHSYAIHTLLLLERLVDKVKLNPLIYVRDRLGHKSVETTMVYLNQIERVANSEALAIIDEFDNLYNVTSAMLETYS